MYCFLANLLWQKHQKPTLNLNDSLNGSGYQTNEELSTIRGSSSNPKALEGNL